MKLLMLWPKKALESFDTLTIAKNTSLSIHYQCFRDCVIALFLVSITHNDWADHSHVKL